MKQQKTSYSTKGLAYGRAVPFWSGVLDKMQVGGAVIPVCKENFTGSLLNYDLGTTAINFWQTTSEQYSRTRQDCMRSRNDSYCIVHVKDGILDVGQGGRTARVHQGESFLLNVAEPFIIHSSVLRSFSSLHMRHELLKNFVPSPSDITAIPILTQNSWGNAMAATMEALTPESIEQLTVAPQALFEHVGCLLSLAVCPAGTPPTGAYHASLLQRFRQSLCEHFYEPDYSPTCLAQEHGVSTRTLYSIFADVKSSFGRELLALRMERARQLLDDPRFGLKPVAEIGRLVGFIYPGHFTTRFRQATGFTPQAYRENRQS